MAAAPWAPIELYSMLCQGVKSRVYQSGLRWSGNSEKRNRGSLKSADPRKRCECLVVLKRLCNGSRTLIKQTATLDAVVGRENQGVSKRTGATAAVSRRGYYDQNGRPTLVL
jgi:hypothetical protein